MVDTSKLGKTEFPLTSFGDLRNAELSPVIQISFEYTVDNTDIITNTTTNGGTVTQAQGMAVVGTSTTTDSTALLQSKQHAKYRAGLGGLARFTALFTTGVANTYQYAGLGDVNGGSEPFTNGYMVGYDGEDFGIHRFQNDVKTSVTQANWNIDKLDGTGNSGMTLDPTKLNVFQIGYQYLGAGEIVFCVEDPNTGQFIPFHKIQYANQNTTPSVFSPNFSLSFWVDNDSTTTDIVMKTASCAYFVEGKTSLIELQQPQFPSGEKTKSGVTTEVAIFTIRNKTTYQSITNHIDVLLELFTGSVEASAVTTLSSIRLVRNATLGGTPSWGDINTSNSVVEIDTSGTTVTGGQELISFPLAGQFDKVIENLVNLKIILNPGETITIAGSSTKSSTINGSLLWKELF